MYVNFVVIYFENNTCVVDSLIQSNLYKPNPE
jgi:hypothetical protein